jgi:hypothetical protein
LNHATIDAKLTREAKYCRAFGELLAHGLSLIFRQARRPSWQSTFRLGARKPGLRPFNKQVALEFSHGGNDAHQHLAGARREIGRAKREADDPDTARRKAFHSLPHVQRIPAEPVKFRANEHVALAALGASMVASSAIGS